MTILLWIVAVLATVLPVAIFVAVVMRNAYLRLHLGPWLATMGAAAALVVPVTFAEQLLQRWAEIDPTAGAGGQVTLLLYGLLVAAPLEMSAVTLAVVPFWRLRRLRMRAGLSRALEVQEGTTFAIAAAMGFSAMRNIAMLWLYGLAWLGVARNLVWTTAFALLCSLWGYILGRYAHRGMASKRFSTAWIVATVFSAVCDQLIFRRGLGALVAVLPLLLSMMVVAWVVWRDAREAGAVSSGGGKLSSIFTQTPAPSLSAIREAFEQRDRPVTLRWIAFGAFVTTGLITTGLVVAVYTGHRVGLDFSAVDQTRVGPEAMAPLAVLGAGALAAFPASGYLLARASGTRSVLEPATAAALAMVLVMVFMGMLAPVSVVFAIAFSPVALALSCVGAWVGLSG